MEKAEADQLRKLHSAQNALEKYQLRHIFEEEDYALYKTLIISWLKPGYGIFNTWLVPSSLSKALNYASKDRVLAKAQLAGLKAICEVLDN